MALICPECGSRTGQGTTEDAFRHIAMCLHVEVGDLRAALQHARSEGGQHGDRVLMGLTMAVKDRQVVSELETLQGVMGGSA